MEPDWRDVRKRMDALTLKQLKPVMAWFNGDFEGMTRKADRIDVMVSLLSHWWSREHTRGRAKNVLKELMEVELQ